MHFTALPGTTRRPLNRINPERESIIKKPNGWSAMNLVGMSRIAHVNWKVIPVGENNTLFQLILVQVPHH